MENITEIVKSYYKHLQLMGVAKSNHCIDRVYFYNNKTMISSDPDYFSNEDYIIIYDNPYKHLIRGSVYSNPIKVEYEEIISYIRESKINEVLANL